MQFTVAVNVSYWSFLCDQEIVNSFKDKVLDTNSRNFHFSEVTILYYSKVIMKKIQEKGPNRLKCEIMLLSFVYI